MQTRAARGGGSAMPHGALRSARLIPEHRPTPLSETPTPESPQGPEQLLGKSLSGCRGEEKHRARHCMRKTGPSYIFNA